MRDADARERLARQGPHARERQREAARVEQAEAPPDRPEAIPGGLWLALVVPAAAWFVDLGVGYGLAGWVCGGGAEWPIHASTAVAAALSGGSLAYAWKVHAGLGDASEDGAGRRAALHFLALTALVAAAFFLLIILASGLPQLMLGEEACFP